MLDWSDREGVRAHAGYELRIVASVCIDLESGIHMAGWHMIAEYFTHE